MSYDVVIIGAGMAGASLAAELAGRGSLALVEAEAAPGYHATGRSAAFWTESYGGPDVQPLTTASGPLLRAGGFLAPRAALTIAQTGHEAELERFASRFAEQGVRIEVLGRADVAQHIPGLRPEWTCGALEPDCCDIDVAGLHHHYLAQARRKGVELLCSARLVAASRRGRGWHLRFADGRELSAELLVNAAGAWADPVAELAGIQPLGIEPFRRTVAQLRTAPSVPASLPLVLDLHEKFYFKPESARLWLSPHDETPSAPCDAAMLRSPRMA